MTASRILIVTTSAATMGSAGEPTGLWLEELTLPFYAFKDAGYSVTLASIAGGAVPIDVRSLKPTGENDGSVARYLKDAALGDAIRDTPRFDVLGADGFDAVFLPGGHGTMFDYPGSRELAAFIENMDRAGKVISAVCHGPAGLVAAKKPDGAPFVSGRRLAAFKDSEERAVGFDGEVPFLLESRLKELGACYESAPDFQPFAVRDGTLVTGQNPASAALVAELVMTVLQGARATSRNE